MSAWLVTFMAVEVEAESAQEAGDIAAKMIQLDPGFYLLKNPEGLERPAMTPEQVAAYFNAEWFEWQIKTWDNAIEWNTMKPLGVLNHNQVAWLAAHLAGNLAQAAMGLEAEAGAKEGRTP